MRQECINQGDIEGLFHERPIFVAIRAASPGRAGWDIKNRVSKEAAPAEPSSPPTLMAIWSRGSMVMSARQPVLTNSLECAVYPRSLVPAVCKDAGRFPGRW